MTPGLDGRYRLQYSRQTLQSVELRTSLEKGIASSHLPGITLKLPGLLPI